MSLPKNLLMILLFVVINASSAADNFTGGGFNYIGETEKTAKGTFKPRVRIINSYSLVFILITTEYASKKEAQAVANKEAERRSLVAQQEEKKKL